MLHPGSALARIMRSLGIVALAGLPALIAASAPASAAAPDAQAVWRDSVSHGAPAAGCYEATFPSAAWKQVSCVTAPTRAYVPRSGGSGGFTVGDGNDYAAVVTSLISSGTGTFPITTGLKKETGFGQPNTYSIQLNSQFFKTTVCNGGSEASKCLGWQQFVYTNDGEAFMQYWLIHYGTSCPSGGWMKYGDDCYRNSAGVRVPTQKIKQLKNLALTGTAKVGGNDTVVMMTKKKAYSASGPDTVVNLGASWNASEFNIIGDGGGSEAIFNAGTSLTVNIALTDGNTTAPACASNSGTTGETNNLNLGACTTAGGTTPSVTFVESN